MADMVVVVLRWVAALLATAATVFAFRSHRKPTNTLPSAAASYAIGVLGVTAAYRWVVVALPLIHRPFRALITDGTLTVVVTILLIATIVVMIRPFDEPEGLSR